MIDDTEPPPLAEHPVHHPVEGPRAKAETSEPATV